jgi:hypothetical protein
MAKCDICNREMMSADSCTATSFVKAGISYMPIPYGFETRFGEDYTSTMPDDKRCHDCNVLKGRIHHPGCDMEECPLCHHQLIGCACNWEELDYFGEIRDG